MGSKDKRTYTDRREYFIQAVAKRRRRLKDMAIEYKGGVANFVDTIIIEGLSIYTTQTLIKKSLVLAAEGYTRSWEKVRAELDKCVLVCSNCHREIEAGLARL